MKLVTLDTKPQGQSGAIIGGDVLDFGGCAAIVAEAGMINADLRLAIAGGELETIRRVVATIEDASDVVKDALRSNGALVPLDKARLLAPIPRPGILLSHGRSYHDHVGEMRVASGGTPGAATEPVGFMKNINSIVGHGAPIRLPATAPDMVDFEGEISVVFGRPCHGVHAKEAMDYVLGFTIVNDVSARDWVPRMKENPDLNRMGKQFATFCPMGPCIATLDEIADPQNIHMVTRLNGAVMQDSWTSDLIWSLPELIAYYSAWYPFQPGDVLTTGTPAGVGYGRTPKLFMAAGDTVSITVDGVGILENPIESVSA